MEAFRWGVIGAGIIANKVMGEITCYERHDLGGVFSRTFNSAKQLTDKFGGIAYNTVEELLSASHIDCIYIATPHSEHYKYMLKCLEYGKPFLCEKSFAVNAAQAEHVYRLAQEKKIYAAEAMWTRFNPVVNGILDIVDSCELGEITSFKADFSVPMQFAPHSERVYSPMLAGGALLDLGIYPISYAQMLMGFPTEITSETHIGKHGTDISDKISLKMESGAKCELSCSFKRLSNVGATIEFEKGSIYSPLFYRPKKAIIKSRGEKRIIKGSAGYIHQFNAVADDVSFGRLQSDAMPQEDSIAVMRILDKVRANSNFTYPEQIEKLSIYD